MSSEVPVIVIHNGSCWSEVGFAGDDSPKAVFPSVVGRPRPRHIDPARVGMADIDCYVGDEAYTQKPILSIKNPVEHGVCFNWDDMEKVY